jgi:chromosome segregation ATPase
LKVLPPPARDDSLPTDFVYHDFQAFNVLTWQTSDLINPMAKTEDSLMLDNLRSQIAELTERLDSKTFENHLNYNEFKKADHARMVAESQLEQAITKQETSRHRIVELSGKLLHNFSALKQANSQITQLREVHNQINADVARVESRLRDAKPWT